ncbi:MAG: 3-isopropylmalate dehydratase small subunit [Rhodospirillaceae bacterium]|jgi:3-isopropylmalate/(R)-2-methylmalate dehydratase small subunit|nr:3-isopropylmalate dehydratase small subunit [Rhodospirillaceae bacterium]MBT3930257.1 3-isopropylmalate dehydratase small subunit [Rhodospirillaceae bacterium]MBT4773316.1 3-isopropylmalate dehydratase small subunit [Rhodospirillaceae bacterium]MBT5769947.1 3-isopropylmalate dehydratase small subunit [Rhodospirillaceae bacterium]MBT6309882.1 3-isopropylmalate dehydratase small subunit [Rhodospirillaceae bacterium]
MEKFNKVTGVAAPLPLVNVDTDKIIPKQFLKTIARTGLGKGLFFEMRTNEDGTPRDDFILDQEPYTKAEILIAGDNFGCGSSREHAPWALQDFGIKVVIAPTFADIFYNNSFKNGMLLVKLPQEQIDNLMSVASDPENPEITVDLEKQEVHAPNGVVYPFELDSFLKHCLLEGLDDIGLTMKRGDDIGDFEGGQRSQQPWLYKRAS